MRPLKTALVGYGKMGRNHYRVISENPKFVPVAIIDPVFTESYFPGTSHIRTSASIDVLESVDWDCVVVAAPTQHHYELGNHLLEFNKPILLEKPLASSPEQAYQLSAKGERMNSKLAVGHLERFNPAILKLKELIDAKWLGEPIHLSFTRVGGYPDHVDEENNVLVDLAVHDLDVLNFLLGPMKVRDCICHSTWKRNVYDTAEIMLLNHNGTSASIHVNWITPTKIRSVRVTGTQGVAFVDYILQTVSLLGGNFLNKAPALNFNFESLIEAYRATDRVEFGIQKEEPLKLQLEEFYRFIVGSESRICTATEASLAVKLAHEAIKKGSL